MIVAIIIAVKQAKNVYITIVRSLFYIWNDTVGSKTPSKNQRKEDHVE
jgi:hypothetical protein